MVTITLASSAEIRNQKSNSGYQNKFFHFSATKGSGQYTYLEKKKTCDLSRPGRYREPPT